MAKEIIVRVRAEGQEKFIKQMKAAGISVEEVGDKTEKAEGKMSGSFKKIGAAIGAAFATQQLIAFGKELAKTAVEIDATNKKLQIVFGDSAKAVDDFARRSATSLGLTVNEYKKAAAAAGDLLVPIGFQRKQAADLSNDLVKLSGALSAWTGGQLNASEVSQILTKALLGEREQLKQLGIQISEADIKSKLLEKGQAKLTGTALAQAKALASLELITAKSADAQAAFADDTKTLAETQLELSASYRQLKDDIAESLIPALSDFLNAALLGIDIIKRLRDDLKELFKLDAETLTLEEKLKRDKELLENAKEGLELAKQREVINENEIAALEDAVKQYNSQVENLEAQIKKKKEALEVDQKINLVIGQQKDKVKDVKDETILLNKVWDEFNTNLLSVAGQFDDITLFENLPELITQAGIEAAFRTVFTNISKDRLDINKKTSEELLAEEERLRIEQIERDKEAQLQIQAERINKANESIDIADTAISGILGLQQQAIQSEIQALEDKNKRGEISDKEYQEKKAELLNKAAKADKAAALTDAIVNTAVGITAQFQAGPAGIALAAIVAALGAAQIAFIASQPIPQFAKGTKGKKKAPAGFKWVGEEGPELLFDGGGYDVLTAGDSEQLSNILASYSIPVQFTRTEDELNKPIKSIKDITTNNAFSKIDWNPLLNASDMQRRSLGKKLDIIHYDLMKVNYGLTRRKTAN